MAFSKPKRAAPSVRAPRVQPQPESHAFAISREVSWGFTMDRDHAGQPPFHPRFICNSSPFLSEKTKEDLHIGVRNYGHWHSI
jgi:hypothetical protein